MLGLTYNFTRWVVSEKGTLFRSIHNKYARQAHCVKQCGSHYFVDPCLDSKGLDLEKKFRT